MTTYVCGALLGLAYGAVFGFLKYYILWQPLMNGKRRFLPKTLAVSQICSVIVNVAVLLVIFFLRHIIPFSFEAVIIAAALALAAVGQISPLRDSKRIAALEKAQQSAESSGDDNASDKSNESCE